MKLAMYAFFTHVLRHQGAEQAVLMAKRCGFEAIEILEGVRPGSPPLFATKEAAEHLRALMEKHGIRCACYSVSINVLAKDMGQDRNVSAVDTLKRIAEIAQILGSPYLHHTLTIGYQPPEGQTVTVHDLLPDLVSHASQVAEYCDLLGLTVLYEPQGYYVNGLDGFPLFYEKMKGLGHPVGVCGDFGNSLYAGCDPTDFFARYAAEMRHVHVKDLRLEDGILNRQNAPSRQWDLTRDGKYITETHLGDGIVDMDACFAKLLGVGYNGTYALETFYRSDKDAPLEQHLLRDKDFVQNKYQSIKGGRT